MKKEIIYLLLLTLILQLSSCSLLYFDTYNTSQTFDYQFDKYEPYLSLDSVYKTYEEKEKYTELKNHFLKIWLHPYEYDTNKVFTLNWVPTKYGGKEYGWRDYFEPDICNYRGNGRSFGGFSIRKVYIDNILHSLNYDTLLVLVLTDEAMLDSLGNLKVFKVKHQKWTRKRMRGVPIKVIVDTAGNWNFICKGISGELMSSGYKEKHRVREYHLLMQSVNREIIRGSYFKKDLTPDPTFWHRLFTNPDIYYPDPNKDGFPLN